MVVAAAALVEVAAAAAVAVLAAAAVVVKIPRVLQDPLLSGSKSSATAGTYPASRPAWTPQVGHVTGSIMNPNAEAPRRKSDHQERFRIVDVEERRSARRC